ncbi:MAG: thioredoxin [Candidatus Shikimatogenerans bostrichidophilus]|nr:MAG: thioredoxin [Candidatus Shikimatogenerans bostrichidophilus]
MKILKEKKIYKKLKNSKFSIIDFWAVWCTPCLYMNPIIEKIYKKYKNKIFIYKINIDENKILTEKYNIKSIPTLIYFKYGNEIERQIGIVSKYNLIEKCKNFIKI